MRLLITNDDGVDAPGLAVLTRVAREFGEPVIVAPNVCHSAKSHSVSMGRPVRVERRASIEGAECYSCGGTPADCVRLGVCELPIGPIELVLAGINPGANLGVDVFYSGTVAAAREGALLGVRSIAVSQLVRDSDVLDWEAIAARARLGLRTLLAGGAKPPRLANLNLPAPRDGGVGRDVRWCPLSLDTWPMVFNRTAEADDRPFEIHNVGDYLERDGRAGDFHEVVRNDHITITPLCLDTTDYAALETAHA
jgi:5'-nucleotidase